LNRSRGIAYILSQLSINLEKTAKEDVGKEILRAGIIAELDAINHYEQMAAMTGNEDIKKILLEIAREEEIHVGAFQAVLLTEDGEQVKELEEGKKEVEEVTAK
jgi:rubrerythrin